MLTTRALTVADVPHLDQIDANFESQGFLDLKKSIDGARVVWELTERSLDPPFASTDYNFQASERAALIERLHQNAGLYLLVEDGQRPVALLDVEAEHWRQAANVWHLFVDRAYRGQGRGRQLLQRAVEWAVEAGLRGIVCETQTNNWPACRFYQKFGFQLGGLDDHFYSNADSALKEVAVFWWYELKG
ncbi:MAG TPA: GNAT family N-acetyltransferase [Anaerolineae bacterium]|nr:GNAT family N-acetyltransferase [Anaerolineae bacterium]